MGYDWTDQDAVIEAVEGGLRETGRGKAGVEGMDSAEEERRLGDLRRIADLARKAPDREVPSNFTAGVMERIGRGDRSWRAAFWVFLSRPRHIRVNLLHLLSGTGALAFLILFLVTGVDRPILKNTASLQETKKEYVVRFSYFDPEARHVYVSGSFNNWRKDQSPLVDPSGRGLWIGAVVMKPGSYEYMFVVDGRWVTDEYALRHKEDGFGRKNAVLTLGIDDEKAIKKSSLLHGSGLLASLRGKSVWGR
jgi:hypothetical protein